MAVYKILLCCAVKVYTVVHDIVYRCRRRRSGIACGSPTSTTWKPPLDSTYKMCSRGNVTSGERNVTVWSSARNQTASMWG